MRLGKDDCCTWPARGMCLAGQVRCWIRRAISRRCTPRHCLSVIRFKRSSFAYLDQRHRMGCRVRSSCYDGSRLKEGGAAGGRGRKTDLLRRLRLPCLQAE